MDKEKKILEYLKIPSLPAKKWNGKDSFLQGLAIVRRITGEEDYAICSFNSETDERVRIIKDFGIIPFTEIIDVFTVPDYMNDDISKMNLDEESKDAMKQLLDEKKEIVNGKVEETIISSEWGYEFIHNKQEAIAYLKSKQIKGRISNSEEVLKAKLREMFHKEQKKKK